MAEYRSPYADSVVLTEQSLNKLIALTKGYMVAGQKTGVILVPSTDYRNLQIQNAHKYASTTSMSMKQESEYNTYENMIAPYASKHPASIAVIDTSVNTVTEDSITWLQGGSLLDFSQTVDAVGADDDGSNNGAIGTFKLVTNKDTAKPQYIQIKGFENGIYKGPIQLSGNNKITVNDGTEAYRYTSTTINEGDPGYNQNSGLRLVGSITTNGGIAAMKSIKGYKLYGAVFNDYAEYRETDITVPGTCVVELGNGKMMPSTERLQAGANIISDTFGFAIGETDKSNTPIAVCGRVLAYAIPDTYAPGDAVCAAPGGVVAKMTREEIREWPDRIVGYVSEIPTYEYWGSDNIKVNGRIWIKVH